MSIVYNMWETINQLLYPIRCAVCDQLGDWLCGKCLPKIKINQHPLCLVCGKPALGGYTHPKCGTKNTPQRLLAPFTYTGPVTSLIKALKYKQYHGVTNYVIDLLLSALKRGKFLSINASIFSKATIIPVPIDWQHRAKRGYNQADMLAKALAVRLNLPYSNKILKRRGFSVSQTSLGRKERKKNVAGKFFITRAPIKDKNFLVIDDVTTTGVTLLEAGKTLKEAGAGNVWCLAVAQQLYR